MSANEGPQAGQGTKAPGRPGAMTMAMQAVQVKTVGPKVLRIGVIQGGKIIEERIVRKRETVTVGGSERNHFVISAQAVGARFELFQLVGSDYILNFTEQMTGRVGLPAGVQSLEQLRTSGAARNAGAHFQVKLTDNSRGKVVIGDTTLLFQFVTPPPVQPRPQLPAAARGGFAKSIDWMFTAFVMFSFMSHFGLVVYLENADWPIDEGINVIPEEYAKFILVEDKPPEPEPEPEVKSNDPAPSQEPAAEKPAKSQESQPKGEEKPAGETAEEKAAAVADASARMAEEAASAAEALLLGALSAEGGGALADVLAGGAVTGNAEDVLAQAAGVGVATGSAGGTLRTRAGGGTGDRTSGLGGLSAAAGAGKIVGEGGAITEKTVKGRIDGAKDADMEGGTGDFDAKLVVAQFKARMRAIQICYEQQLRRNPGLQGKVTVQFTIEQSGSVSKATATENTTNDPAVAACVTDTVRRFRFNPGPEGGSVTFSYPIVFAPQG